MASSSDSQIFQTPVTPLLIGAPVFIARCFKAIFLASRRLRLMHSMFVRAAAISLRASCITFPVILICAVSASALDAQEPHNIQDDTKAALAKAWIQPNGVQHLINALGLLTSSSEIPFKVNLEVLGELTAADPTDEDLYRAAIGIPDANGRPTVQGIPDFLDILAKANTLGKKKQDEDELFDSTQKIIDDIFGTGPGKLALVRVHDSFSQSYNYLALYQLLQVTWKKGNPKDLEKLRAAFEMNTVRLASQVAAKITAAK